MSLLLKTTPCQDGFRMPAEFERHAGCWMIWPERHDSYRLGAKPAQKAYAEVAAAISQFEPVTMCVSPAQYVFARNRLPANIRVVEMAPTMRGCAMWDQLSSIMAKLSALWIGTSTRGVD